MTYGQILKDKLGLSDYRKVYIRKLVSTPIEVYSITYDSHRPSISILNEMFNKFRTLKILKPKQPGMHSSALKLKKYKTYPPQLIEEFDDQLPTSAILIVNDIAGEYLYQ